MMGIIYYPESELEMLLLRQIDAVKKQYPMWRDPYQLSRALGLRIVLTGLGSKHEGAAWSNAIALDPSAGGPSRRFFTIYHEILHHLIKSNDVLYSILHDQYRSEKDLERICEYLANVGAAEFLLAREIVRTAINESGFSIALITELSAATNASMTAICVQLVLCAGHRCLGIVCRMMQPGYDETPSLGPHLVSEPVLHVETAVSSRSMKYSMRRGTPIPAGHFLHSAWEAEGNPILRSVVPIPFRNRGTEPWVVDCEAIRIGEQVFALFHADPPPASHRDQMRLF